jgi:acetolactate synthase I/II/III large subunit
VATTGADVICRSLFRAGVRHVFGLPGTQTVPLYDALRRSGLRTVTTTSELAAAFAATGYFRASGRLAAVSTIPGPGLTWALTALAEAHADSAAMVCIVGMAPLAERRRHALQVIDQQAVGKSLVKAWRTIESPEDLGRVIRWACGHALEGEPGPVVVEVGIDLLHAEAPDPPAEPIAGTARGPDLDAAVHAVTRARRPVFYVGAGAHAAAGMLARVVERLHVPVCTTPSGRGALPEDHPWSIPFDFVRHRTADLNALLASADAVVAIGCKLTHNGTGGFALELPEARLVYVNADPEAVGSVKAAHAVVADAGDFLARAWRRHQPRVTGTCRRWPPGAPGFAREPRLRPASLRWTRHPAGGPRTSSPCCGTCFRVPASW